MTTRLCRRFKIMLCPLTDFSYFLSERAEKQKTYFSNEDRKERERDKPLFPRSKSQIAGAKKNQYNMRIHFSSAFARKDLKEVLFENESHFQVRSRLIDRIPFYSVIESKERSTNQHICDVHKVVNVTAVRKKNWRIQQILHKQCQIHLGGERMWIADPKLIDQLSFDMNWCGCFLFLQEVTMFDNKYNKHDFAVYFFIIPF